MTDYRPIPCQRYAELEIAVMHRVRLRVGWHTSDGKVRVEQLRPTDIRTRDHEEYLIAEGSNGHPVEIRLDRISRFSPL